MSGPTDANVSGSFQSAGLAMPPAPSSAFGTPGVYWQYFTAPGNYLIAQTATGIVATPTGRVAGGMVVAVPAQGLYTVTA